MPPRKDPDLAYMTTDEFETILRHIYGPYGQAQFAGYCGLSRSQVNRYANGVTVIPKQTAVLLHALKILFDLGVPFPDPQPVPSKVAARVARATKRAKLTRRAEALR